MLARAQTWWTILRISLEERLVYRGDFWIGTMMRFLPIVTQVFLWGAVFAGMGAAANGSGQIAGFNYSDMVAYYLLAMVGRAFSSMPGLASGIALQIRNGEIKKYPRAADRSDRLSVPDARRPQARVLRRRARAVRRRLLPVPRLLLRLAAGRRARGVRRSRWSSRSCSASSWKR